MIGRTALVCLLTILYTVARAGTRYYSVTLDGKQAGYRRGQTDPAGSGVKVTSDCLIKLNMLGAPFDLSYQAIGVYAAKNDRLPARYTVTLNAGPRSVTADCKFTGAKVD